MTDKILINLSNHPSHLWSNAQLDTAKDIGEIRDIPFPMVDEDADKKVVFDLANQYIQQITLLGSPSEVTIHIMGEQTFCYYFISEIKKLGYTCIASTSKRIVNNKLDDTKEVTFSFCRFREY